jgi:hypothetical protein
VALASEDCDVHASREAIESDDTVWFGSMLPLKGPTFGEQPLRALDLARQDFDQMMAGYAKAGGEVHVRPFGVVSCDDTRDAMRAARHLVEGVHTPAIIGFRSAAELIDVGSALLVPNHVVAVASLTTSPLATSLPTAPGQPRLVWRTTYSSAESARAIGHVVPDLLEPALRRSGGGARENAAIRVALVRQQSRGGTTFDSLLFKALRFNGKSALENGDDYREVVARSDDGGEARDFNSAATELVSFAPRVVIVIIDGPAGLMEAVERRWPRAAPRPVYLFITPIEAEVLRWVGGSAERRHRALGLSPMMSRSVTARFVLHYNESAQERVTAANAPSESFDAFYLLAYATFASADDAPVTGASLARSIAHLVPPGPRVDVGPAQIFDAFNALRRGERIDLDGAASALDFDLATGETHVDHAVVCASVDADGKAAGVVESGVIYRSAEDRLEGDLACP